MSEKLATGYLSFDIPQVIEAMPELFLGSQVLITVRDSGLGSEMCRFAFPFELWPDAALIPYSSMPQFLQLKFFDGFDEIYILTSEKAKPSRVNKTFQPPTFDFEKEVPSEFFEIFAELKAIAFFSDGVGANFAVPESVLPQLQKMSAST